METFSVLLALCAGNSPVPVNSPHKDQWRGALMFSFIYARINDWVNNREAGDLRRQRGHYDVIVMWHFKWVQKHGVHLTMLYDPNLAEKGVDLMLNILISSGHNFAHITTAQFWWHMQINWIIRIKTKVKWISTKCYHVLINRLLNGSWRGDVCDKRRVYTWQNNWLPRRRF